MDTLDSRCKGIPQLPSLLFTVVAVHGWGTVGSGRMMRCCGRVVGAWGAGEV